MPRPSNYQPDYDDPDLGDLGSPAGGRPVVGEPVLDFLGPPPTITVPYIVPVILPKPSIRPTKPMIVKPGYTRDWSRHARRLQVASRKAAQTAAEADRLRRLKYMKLAKLGPWLTGFQIGWELGDYLFPEGWYSFVEGGPDETVGPNGWEYIGPAGAFNSQSECTFRCDGFGQIYWTGTTAPGAGTWSNGTLRAACAAIGCGVLSEAPIADVTATPANPYTAFATYPGSLTLHGWNQKSTNAAVAVKAWAISRFNGATPLARVSNPDNWVQHTTIADTLPLQRSRPSEFPESFPMEWPMEMPYPQKFKEAVPDAGTQGEGKHRRGSYSAQPGARTFPRMPLAPFPIVTVVPPGGNVPPPPDQEIDIPPPNPPGSGGGSPPVTYRTSPPRGRKPPGKKTKEKKLMVRTVRGAGLWVALNLATEVFDFIDALFRSIPEDIQKRTRASIDYGKKGGGNADPYSKARAIYDNFGKIDWDKFVNTFINQQLTDMAIGLVGMGSQQALKFSGAATGSGGVASKPAGLTDKYIDGKVERGELTKAEGEALKKQVALPIPQVSYQDGEWTVSVPQWGLTIK